MHKTIFKSLARTATVVSPPISTENHLGGRFFFHISAITAGSVTPVIQVQDELSGTWIDLVGGAFTAKTATGVSELTIYPGVIAVANGAVNNVLTTFRVTATMVTGPATFSMGVILLGGS